MSETTDRPTHIVAGGGSGGCALAARLSEQIGRTVRADAFRQQLRRARKHFAKLIVAEVQQTLQNPTAEAVEQELFDLDLMPFVREFL